MTQGTGLLMLLSGRDEMETRGIFQAKGGRERREAPLWDFLSSMKLLSRWISLDKEEHTAIYCSALATGLEMTKLIPGAARTEFHSAQPYFVSHGNSSASFGAKSGPSQPLFIQAMSQTQWFFPKIIQRDSNKAKIRNQEL